MPGGLWLMLIGGFLYKAAQSSYQQSTLQESLSEIKVKDIMVKDIVTLSSSMTIDEAVNGYFLRYGYGGFPVVDDGKFLGIVTLKEVKDVPKENWGRSRVVDILVPHDRSRGKSVDVKLPDHKTKIVCTIRPASRSETVLEALMKRRTNVAGLNLLNALKDKGPFPLRENFIFSSRGGLFSLEPSNGRL